MFRFLKRKLRNESDAKDVLQEFYVKALTRFDDLKDEDRLRGWLSQILHSTIADHFQCACPGADEMRKRVQSVGLSETSDGAAP